MDDITSPVEGLEPTKALIARLEELINWANMKFKPKKSKSIFIAGPSWEQWNPWGLVCCSTLSMTCSPLLPIWSNKHLWSPLHATCVVRHVHSSMSWPNLKPHCKCTPGITIKSLLSLQKYLSVSVRELHDHTTWHSQKCDNFGSNSTMGE